MAAIAPRLTSHQAVKREARTRHCTVLFERAHSVDGTGGLETARTTQPGTEQQTIAFHQPDQGILRQVQHRQKQALHG